MTQPDNLDFRLPLGWALETPISREAVEHGVTCYFQGIAGDTFMS